VADDYGMSRRKNWGVDGLKENIATRGLRRSLYQEPAVNVPVSPAWRQQALINAVVAAQGGQSDRQPKFSTAPQ
jgi:hypothetical protein